MEQSSVGKEASKVTAEQIRAVRYVTYLDPEMLVHRSEPQIGGTSQEHCVGQVVSIMMMSAGSPDKNSE